MSTKPEVAAASDFPTALSKPIRADHSPFREVTAFVRQQYPLHASPFIIDLSTAHLRANVYNLVLVLLKMVTAGRPSRSP